MARSESFFKNNVHFFLLLIGGSCIGFAPIFVKLSISEIGPVSIAFWRLFLATPVFLTLLSLDKEKQTKPKEKKQSNGISFLLLFAGLAFALDLAVWHWSIKLTTAANATIIGNCSVIILTLIEWIWLKHSVKKVFLFGMALALIGVTIIAGSSFQIGLDHLYGDSLAILTAVFYATYLLTVKQLRKKYTTTKIMAWASASCAVFLWPMAYFSGELILPATISVWGFLIGLALISHVMGQGLIARSLAHLPASLSGVVLLIQPVIATILGVVILHEPVSFYQGIGGITVLGGIYLARRSQSS